MLKLADFLSIDDQYQADAAIADCVGDRYLYSNNSLFRRVRDCFLSCGFRYSCEASALKQDYDAGPFFMLQDLLAEGILPYRKNIGVLRRVVARNPELELSPNLLLSQLTSNYLLHESAHFIAHRTLPVFSSASTRTEERFQFVLCALAAEAFANVTEQFTHCSAEKRLHVLFLGLNSYIQFTEEKRRLLAHAVHLFGERPLFRFGFLCMLYANSHAEPPSDTLIHDWTKLAFPEPELSDIHCRLLAILASTSFTLRAAFRDETTRMFFRVFNCEDEFIRCSRQQFCLTELHSLGISKWMTDLSTTVFHANENLPQFNESYAVSA